MKTVKEVSSMSGISIRTLHYYDTLELLCPSEIGENGYRYYDDDAIGKLQEILFFKELGFPLKEIKRLMEDPYYNKEKALENHIVLLELKKKRLLAMIDLAREVLKGDRTMDFKAFDRSEIEEQERKYKAEAKERWGNTAAYQESETKSEKYTEEQWQAIRKEMADIMEAVGKLVGTDPADQQVQALVKAWQEHLTRYYYDCTKEILGCLGQMYVADERFTANIDVYGKGTAALLSAAIAVYVK